MAKERPLLWDVQECAMDLIWLVEEIFLPLLGSHQLKLKAPSLRVQVECGAYLSPSSTVGSLFMIIRNETTRQHDRAIAGKYRRSTPRRMPGILLSGIEMAY